MHHEPVTSFFLAASWVILVFPFVSFVVNGLWLGHKHPDAAGWFSVLMAIACLGWVSGTVHAYVRVVQETGHAIALVPWSFTWINFDGVMAIRVGALIDPISIMMLAVVAIIALMVNIYSMGYMHDDPSRGRFFSLLSLFTFAMMGLVLAADLIQMYMFWELVGVSSYLLIGFWYQKPEAVAASKKAFIVTRFADAFFLLGIVLVGYTTRDFSFLTLNDPDTAVALNRTVSLGFFSVNTLAAGTVLLFAGGWGKSAMFPLHVWLPDAMEGPTPVSSIIHSATMVVAGVYLTARLFPLFSAAGSVLPLVMVVGAFTAIFAAVIACTQMDIKRILAFSTLSQIGYMMFALGVTQPAESGAAIETLGYTASMFHVFTHAFFKCLLFLGAGVVIHAVHTNTVAKMGGLRKTLPLTCAGTLVACLAIAGIFPFSGFFSKDEILLAALASGHRVVLAMGLITGALTAFYMFRYFFLIFGGESRNHAHHIHETRSMTLPILLLAIPSVAAGWYFKDIFMNQVLPPGVSHGSHNTFGSWVPWAATVAAVLGIAVAWWMYQRRTPGPQTFATEGRPGWYRVIQNKFYIDEVWLWFARRLMIGGVAPACRWVDRTLVDGSVNGSADALQGGCKLVRAAHNGLMYLYIGVNALGVMVLYWLLLSGVTP
jgi:NADH-quinone oxidoreductase subunit L